MSRWGKVSLTSHRPLARRPRYTPLTSRNGTQKPSRTQIPPPARQAPPCSPDTLPRTPAPPTGTSLPGRPTASGPDATRSPKPDSPGPQAPTISLPMGKPACPSLSASSLALAGQPPPSFLRRSPRFQTIPSFPSFPRPAPAPMALSTVGPLASPSRMGVLGSFAFPHS
jgi:hypothetical protein